MKPGEPEVLPFQCLAHLGPDSIRKCAGFRRLVLSTYPPPPPPTPSNIFVCVWLGPKSWLCRYMSWVSGHTDLFLSVMALCKERDCWATTGQPGGSRM